MQKTSETLEWKSAAPIAPEATVKTKGVFLLIVLGAFWAILFNQLRVEWSINPQYYYGWAAPLLALGLFHLRWDNRPEPEAPGSKVFVGLIVALSIAALLPLRLAEEANPEWRMVLWAHGAQMVALTGCVLYATGGWPWVKHWAFPTLFILVAIPWPVQLEQKLIQNLMHGVAAVTAELAEDILGIPAVQNGSVIQISTGLVGIDEACSGVRSLQTTLFATLFLGELYRFATARRILLVLGGFTVALGANVARTMTLVWIAAKEGLGPMHHWHDTVGGVVLIITLLGVWALANVVGRKSKPPPARTNSLSVIPSLPRPVLLGCVAWIFATEAGTEWWYRSHESRLPENSHWSINWPAAEGDYREEPIDDAVRATLRFTEGRQATWRDEDANRWVVFLFRWAPGRNSVQLARTHTPEICLTGVGYHLESELGIMPVKTHGLELPVRRSVFSRNGEPPLYVFYCLWEERGAQDGEVPPGNGVINFSSRMKAIRAGERHLGQQVMEVAIRGPATPDEAAELFHQQIERLVQR